MIAIKKTTPEGCQLGGLSRLDFGKPLGQLGCFLNYEPKQLLPPSERQLAALNEEGVCVPEGTTNKDASAMLSRIGVWEIAPGPSPDLVDLAESLGTEFSAFTSAEDLIGSIITQAAEQDRAALYCYGVACSKRGQAFGNLFADPDAPLFIGFADVVAADPAMRKSLAALLPDDFKRPKKAAKICKAAVAHLAGGGVV